MTGQEKDAVWKAARDHGLLALPQGSQKFDEALFRFAEGLSVAKQDMLALLKEMLAEFEDHPTHGTVLFVERIRDVIAKAEQPNT